MRIKLAVIGVLPFIIFVLLLYSCEKGTLCIKGKGEVISESRDVGAFKKIHLMDSDASVNVAYGTDYTLTINGQKNVLKELTTNVRNEVLEIEYERCVRKHDGIDITITTPDIEGVKVSSDGIIVLTSVFHTANFEAKLSGSGTIFLDSLYVNQLLEFELNGTGNIECWELLKSKETNIILNSSGVLNINNHSTLVLKASINGSGSVYINSNVPCSNSFISDVLEISNTSSGIINAFGNCARNVSVYSYGSGQSFVQAIDGLLVEISGSGDVVYKGTAVVTEKITGSGNLKKVN